MGWTTIPPPKIWKISGYLHKETCKMHLFSTLSQFSKICRGNIFYIFLFVIWKHCKIVKFLLACMKNVWHFSVLETPPYMVNNFLINFLDELDRYIHFLKFPFQKKSWIWKYTDLLSLLNPSISEVTVIFLGDHAKQERKVVNKSFLFFYSMEKCIIVLKWSEHF